MSFLLDIKIIFMTIYTFLKGSNNEISKLGIKAEIDQLKKFNKTIKNFEYNNN